MGGVAIASNNSGGGGFFDSFSSFIGNIGSAVGQVTGTIGNFITQRENLRIQRAQAQAQLAALKQGSRIVTGAQVQPTAASNAQRQYAGGAGLSGTIAGVSISTLLLIGAAIMAYKVLK